MRGTNKTCRLVLLTLAPVLAISMTAGCASAPTSGVQPDGSFRETFEAFAVAMGTSYPPIIPPGTNATIQINITRWTTPEEREMLLAELMENGQKGLVPKLQKQEETGWVFNRSQTAQGARTRAAMGTSAPSQRLRYAWQIDRGAGRRRIVAALDRPIGWAEASRQPRWRDYDMTLIVLDVDEDGNGTGQVAVGVQLAYEPTENKLVIENFGSEPVRLTNVQRR